MSTAGAETAERAQESGTEQVWDKSKDQFESKRVSKYFDPCQEAANKSIRCMNRNQGDKDMCQDYFQAYRDCKKEWTRQRKEATKASGKGWFS